MKKLSIKIFIFIYFLSYFNIKSAEKSIKSESNNSKKLVNGIKNFTLEDFISYCDSDDEFTRKIILNKCLARLEGKEKSFVIDESFNLKEKFEKFLKICLESNKTTSDIQRLIMAAKNEFDFDCQLISSTIDFGLPK